MGKAFARSGCGRHLNRSSRRCVRRGRGVNHLMSRIRSGIIQVAQSSVAPFLLLVAPFLGYVQYQRYGLSHPEVALFVLVLAGVALLLGAGCALSPAFSVATLAGLLTFFVDIQVGAELGLKKLGVLFLGLCVLVWVFKKLQ